MQSEVRGCSFIGASVCLHRIPRNSWAVTPKTREKSIHPQSISCMTVCSISLKSVLRYIHHNIVPPKMNGRAILTIFFIVLFLSIKKMS